MTQYSTRFGLLSISEEQVWQCVAPLPGFTELQRFALLHVQEHGPFVWLQSLDEPLITFLLVAPAHFGLHYPQRPHFALQEAEGTSMVMAILPQQAKDSLHANALAPLYFMPGTRQFGQWIVEHPDPDSAVISEAKRPPLTLYTQIVHLEHTQQELAASPLTIGAA